MRRKSTTFTFRIHPDVKKAMEIAAEVEHRTSGNLLEVLIISYCEKIGIPVEATRRKPGNKSRVASGGGMPNNQ